MSRKSILIFSLIVFLHLAGYTQKVKTTYVDAFQNINHPEVAYWFLPPI